jgi:4-amino-4-deoxy-L-arabinose transferase-like glycosyltransferase
MTQSPIPNLQYPIPHSKRQIRHWALLISLLLLAWGLRLCCLETIPPGWRDDELINIHALSGEVLAGRFPLYFTGASGHEPLYHYVHAGVHALLGFNVLSGHLLSVVCGTLAVALTYGLARRLFGRATAAVASLALATSFWSLMYSRTGMRHISATPFALAVFYLLWPLLTDRSLTPNLQPPTSNPQSPIPNTQSPMPNTQSPTGPSPFIIPHIRYISLGLLLGASLYTYTAARLLPLVLVLFAAYLALFHRDRFTRHWRGLLLALGVAAVLAAPLALAIAQGRSEAAAQGIGADARLAELALPLRALRGGNPRPLLESTWTTLGMFHATGDPEWLYNVSDRPVFNLLGGALLWAGVALCLYRWRRPRYFFLLLWLGLGLLPAFLSIPPASLSHTILAQPVAYILPALALAEAYHWLRSRDLKPTVRSSLLVICHLSFVIFLTTNAFRDLQDYFVTWPQRGMVRFLYRADYREAAHYLDSHPEVTDLAVSSALMGPWDRLALAVDTHRDDVAVRLFSPERALVWAGDDAPMVVLLASSARPASPIDGLLEASGDPLESAPPHLALHRLRGDVLPTADASRARFANGLELTTTHWLDEEVPAPGREAVLLTGWLVAQPLRLPPMPIVANPPPPGVYSGPRLAVFTHLLAADGTFLVGDDGLWVDPLTLQPSDRFIQVHRLALPSDAPAGPYVLEVGMYDPMTGDRWPILEADGQPGLDRRLIPVEEGL